MINLMLVMVAGAAGVGMRYGLASALGAAPGLTLAVNVVGAIAIGVLVAVLAAHDHGTSSRAYAVLGIGLLGGFTTYSAFALDTVTLLETGHVARAAAYVVATNVLAVLGCWLGLSAGRAIT